MVSRSAQASFEETPWADIKFSINNGFPIYEYFDFSKYTADGIKLEELKQAQQREKYLKQTYKIVLKKQAENIVRLKAISLEAKEHMVLAPPNLNQKSINNYRV